MSNTEAVLQETGTAYLSRASGFTSGFCAVRVANLFSFLCYFALLICVLCLVPNVAIVSKFCIAIVDRIVFSDVYRQSSMYNNQIPCNTTLMHVHV